MTRKEQRVIRSHYPHLKLRFRKDGTVEAQKTRGGSFGLLYTVVMADGHIRTVSEMQKLLHDTKPEARATTKPFSVGRSDCTGPVTRHATLAEAQIVEIEKRVTSPAMPDGYQLRYSTPTRTIPSCWTISASYDGASGGMGDLFEKSLEPITSVWVERWEGGVLKGTVHLYPDCAAEAFAS